MDHHLASHINHGELRSDNTLHVIGVTANPARFHSRYRLTREWQKHMMDTPNVKLHMVESAFGDRHHEVVDGLDSVLRLRTNRMYDAQGMIQLVGKPDLERAIRLYNRSRGEDSIEDT
jgi:hypothetical protein